MIGYHVSSAEAYRNHISKEGLIPKLGDRSFEMYEPEKRVYFFSSMDALEDGVTNWLGDALADFGVEEIAILKVDLSNMTVENTFDGGSMESWEMYTTNPVPPERITLVRYEPLNESVKNRIRDILQESMSFVAMESDNKFPTMKWIRYVLRGGDWYHGKMRRDILSAYIVGSRAKGTALKNKDDNLPYIADYLHPKQLDRLYGKNKWRKGRGSWFEDDEE